MSKPNLKPCPFCGGEAIEYLHHNTNSTTDYVMHIVCRNCGAAIKPYIGTKEYVVKASRVEWNSRTEAGEKKQEPVNKCRDCIHLCGEKTTIGIECLEPSLQWKWKGKYYRGTTARYKYPSNRACKRFQPKVKGEDE